MYCIYNIQYICHIYTIYKKSELRSIVSKILRKVPVKAEWSYSMNFEMHFENIEKYTEKSKKKLLPDDGGPIMGLPPFSRGDKKC